MDEVFNSKRIAPRLTNVSLRCENEGVEFQVLKALRASDRSVRALWGLDHGRADEAEAAFRAAHLRRAGVIGSFVRIDYVALSINRTECCLL